MEVSGNAAQSMTSRRRTIATWRRAPWAAAALLLLGASAATANPAPTTVTYRNSHQAVPDKLEFRIGDRLTFGTDAQSLQGKLVGRTVTVTGRIQWFKEEVVTGRHKESSFGCGFLGLGACYKETRERRYDKLTVSKVTPTRFDSFVEVGPVLVVSTPAGNASLMLMGADGKAREALKEGGFTYVALHSGTLHFGSLTLPPGTFDKSPSATEQEKKDGEAWVQSQCAGRPECSVLANPPVQVTATAGSVKLELVVNIERPTHAAHSP